VNRVEVTHSSKLISLLYLTRLNRSFKPSVRFVLCTSIHIFTRALFALADYNRPLSLNHSKTFSKSNMDETIGVLPPALKPRDTIAFISPSSRLNRLFPSRVYRGKTALENLGYRVKIFFNETPTTCFHERFVLWASSPLLLGYIRLSQSYLNKWR
jgi:hypothetical protein